MSFVETKSLKGEVQSQDAPVYHILPYITGGLETLVKRIRTESVPELADYGYHTNSEGHFEPVGECLMGLRYRVKQKLDTKGHSAALVLAEDLFSQKKLVVIKVLHSHFYRLGSQESHILWKLAVADPLNHSHTLRLLTTLTFDSHFCMVFEPLLPEPLTNIFQEFPTHRVLPNLRKVGLRLLATIGFLHQQNMIHTDLKPENILLKHESDLDSVHIVDFGNAVNYVHREVSLYYNDFELQTPLYRAPEVIFGLPFGTEIDMWSLGCILAELYTGEPLFYGLNKEEIVKQITKLLGPFHAAVFKRGKFYEELQQYTSTEDNSVQVVSVLMDHLQCRDVAFVELLAGLLRYNPDERLTAKEAACHPFFASYFPVGFLLGDASSGTSCYSSKHISPKSYTLSPHVSSSIKRKQPSSLDLLKLGTIELSPCKTNTGVIRPKPIELLNERRKLHSRKSLDKTEMHNEMGGARINKEYVEVLDKAKDGVKLSDNVKEKMSSLLKAIKDEQSLVENDLERKSKEMTLEEDKCSLSFGKKRQFEKTSKTEKNETRESRDKRVDHKVETIKVPTPYNCRKPVVPDDRNDTKHTSKQRFDRSLYHRLDESQSQPLSMDTENSFDHKDERKSFERSSIIENRPKDRLGNSDIVHCEASCNRSKCRNTSMKSKESSHNDSVKSVGPINTNSFVSCENYSPRTKVVQQSSKRHDKHESSQPTDKGNDGQSDKNVSGEFDEMFTDATTPKHNKHTLSDLDDNEYVDIISPFDHMSASKRQISERKQRLISSSKKKGEILSYKPVRPKAVVRPDSWREYLSLEKNDNSTTCINSQNKASLSVTTEYSTKGHLENSDSEDEGSDIEIVLDKRRETDEDISQDSTRRKSFDKASGKIRNLKKNEIKFRGYDLYVKKERQENQRIQKNDHRTLVSSRSDQSNAKKDAVQSRESSTNHRLKETTHATNTTRTEAVTLQKERLVYSQRLTIPDTYEQNITPIPKAGMHEATTESSPEIVYKSKNVSEKGNSRQLSQAQTSESHNCKKNEGQKRHPKQRNSVGKQIDKSTYPNVADSNLDLVKSRTERRHVAAEDYNLCNTKNNSQSILDDPFEFSGTPGSSVKKVNREFEGIGERIEQKRSKVKKKARKSLMFEREDLDNCEEADNDRQSDSSSDLQHNALGVEADCFTVENREMDRNRLGNREINTNRLENREIYKNRAERREIMERKNQYRIQNKLPVVANKEFPNRKRPLSHDIKASPANLVTKEKKTKGSIGQTITGTFDVAGKRPKLSQALDTTYTIDSFKLKQKHN